MRRRKRPTSGRWLLLALLAAIHLLAGSGGGLFWQASKSPPPPLASALLLLTTNCLTSSPGCVCSWKSGKFVADCPQQNLTQVPKNDYNEFLQSSGNHQMSTLNRDIQQLNLASNNLTRLEAGEFVRKRFRNLQKINLSQNQLRQIHSGAFQKLTGLIELDLSDNQLRRLTQAPPLADDVVGLNRSLGDDDDDGKSAESFLGQLGQLRALNLNSNQLVRLGKFAFSATSQLRQLLLSRNQISSIDKRAFDGLNVLNILHLDGNKLSHLDGAALFRLGQLHAIQLGGSNPWRCDCRLRGLLRQLAAATQPEEEEIGEGSLGGQLRLLDEPQCSGAKLEPANATKSGLESPRLWKNMRASRLECPARLAGALVQRRLARRPGGSMNMNAPARKGGAGQAESWRKPSAAAAASDPLPRLLQLETEEVSLAPGEPLELTCPSRLADELELAHQLVEWWRLAPQSEPLLMWRSADEAQANASAPTTTTTTTTKGDRFAVIDYVTRANRSSAAAAAGEDSGEMSEEDAADKEEEDDKEEPALVRVVQVVALEGQLEGRYLCRVTTGAGGFELVVPVRRAPDGGEVAASNNPRRPKTSVRSSSASMSLNPPLRLAANVQNGGLAGAMRQLRALNPSDSKAAPLFVPIHLPAELLSAMALDADEEHPAAASVARSLATGQQQPPPSERPQRPRQTSANQTAPSVDPMIRVGQEAASQLGAVALALVRRFTSNQRHLMRPEPTETGEGALVDGADGKLGRPFGENWGQRVAVERQQQPQQTKRPGRALGEALTLLLLGLGAGLLAGCLLSLLLANFRPFRCRSAGRGRRGGRSARVASGSPSPPSAPMGADLSGSTVATIAQSPSSTTSPIKCRSLTPLGEGEATVQVAPSVEGRDEKRSKAAAATRRRRWRQVALAGRRLEKEEAAAEADEEASWPEEDGGEEDEEEGDTTRAPLGFGEGHLSLQAINTSSRQMEPLLLVGANHQAPIYAAHCWAPPSLLPPPNSNSCEEATEESGSTSLMLSHLGGSHFLTATTTTLGEPCYATAHHHHNQPLSGYIYQSPPSTTDSSQPTTTQQHQQQQQQIVYLEDALQLLHNSMSHCYLVAPDSELPNDDVATFGPNPPVGYSQLPTTMSTRRPPKRNRDQDYTQ